MTLIRRLIAMVCYRCAGTGGGCRDCGIDAAPPSGDASREVKP